MYEHRRDPILSLEEFLRRLLRHAGIAMGILAGSLMIGVVGFRYLADTAWIDALLNASMLLGGMGPVGELQNWSASGKIFASVYALYSGLIFLIVASVLIAPVFHRFLHHFHLEMSDKKKKKSL
jgi:hypothetical protein